ncbi:MAG: MASE1 domain-containing protein [Gemmatimonadetes bacterium]|nr:MASE1 domain-containing protein [Gemmatimonadota bacterium]
MVAFLRARPIATNLLLAVAYAAIGHATLTLGEAGDIEIRRVIWASSGFAVAAALLLPFSVWWGVALGGAATTLLSGDPLPHVLLTGSANAMEVVLAVGLLRRARFDVGLRSVTDVLLLLALASGLSAALAATISVTSLKLFVGLPSEAVPMVAIQWWLTHAMGILIITPVVLVWSRTAAQKALAKSLPSALPRRTEVLAVIVASFAAAWWPFTAEETSLTVRLFFLPIPVLLWGAVRLGMRWAATGALVTTAIAVLAAVGHTGPFTVAAGQDDPFSAAEGQAPPATAGPNQTLTLTWVFANVVMLSTLVTAALVEGLLRSQREHANGERRLRAVLDASGEGIVVADPAGIVTHINDAIVAIWPVGLRAPVVGEPIEPPLDGLIVATETPDARSLLIPPADTARLQGMLTFTDGRVWEVEVDQLPGATRRGDRLWSFRDVSARVRAEAERRELEAQLLHSQKLESLGVLAGGIAHDFNNLLMAIRGRADLLAVADGLPKEAEDDVEGIVHTVDEAANLCRQMLAYAGRGAIETRTVDLTDCAREIKEMLRVSVSRRVALEMEWSDTPLPVSGDVTQLRQVVLNLVTNAADAVETSGHDGRVTVRTRLAVLDREWLARQVLGGDLEPGAYALLEVLDNGVGMDAATARRIFDPFFSSKGAGRGLGLASALGVIRSHRGALRLESFPGGGSHFTVALPLADEEAAPAAPSARSVADRLRGRRILVVDDEESVRSVVTRLLTRMGMFVEQARDGEEALAQLGTPAGRTIDVVLLDVMMPRRGGPATLAEIRARGWTVPVVMASGFSAEAVPESVRLSAFVQKPFSREVLEEALASVLSEPASSS